MASLAASRTPSNTGDQAPGLGLASVEEQQQPEGTAARSQSASGGPPSSRKGLEGFVQRMSGSHKRISSEQQRASQDGQRPGESRRGMGSWQGSGKASEQQPARCTPVHLHVAWQDVWHVSAQLNVLAMIGKAAEEQPSVLLRQVMT